MAHLMASPFHKPSPLAYDSRRPFHPISPPDSETAHPKALSLMSSSAGFALPDPRIVHAPVPVLPFTVDPDGAFASPAPDPFAAPTQPLEPEHPRSHFRKTSTLAYRSTGLLDARERNRGPKPLIIVIPPPSLAIEHGQLGHTLSSGPSHRLSQGILMPLFPTMFAQLSAIAREFNFPSPAGICLYLHVAAAPGAPLTPRISDDAWPSLWAHALDPPERTPAAGPPLAGRVEFELDPRRARWHDAWRAAALRDALDVPADVTSRAQSAAAHSPQASRTTLTDEQSMGVHPQQQDAVRGRAPPRGARVPPRQLSLVDRLEAFAFNPSAAPRYALESPEDDAPAATAASVTNDDDAARGPGLHALDALDTIDEPRTATQDLQSRVNDWRAGSSVAPTPRGPPPALDLAEYTWTPSSAGPPSWPPSPAPSAPREPTPDIAFRAMGGTPAPPSPATSWGAPSPPPSPAASMGRVPTPDIALRVMEEAPRTPGAADVPERYWTPFEERPGAHVWEHVWPYVSYGGASTPWEHVWPYVSYGGGGAPWEHVWPYVAYRAAPRAALPWRHVWPYVSYSSGASQQRTRPAAAVHAPSVYPHLQIYRAVYPHFDIYPPIAAGAASPEVECEVKLSAGYPFFSIYPAVYPSFDLYGYPVDIKMGAGHWSEASTCDATGHPYPQIHAARGGSTLRLVATALPPSYPSFNLYPVGYPHLEIYPAVFLPPRDPAPSSGARGAAVGVALPGAYPALIIYRPTYPYNLECVYPPIRVEAQTRAAPERAVAPCTWAGYPDFDLYAILYPKFNLYPPVSGVAAAVRSPPVPAAVRVQLQMGYPRLDIYSPVYPHFEIYGAFEKAEDGAEARARAVAYEESGSRRPCFDLYPAVRPYPDVSHLNDHNTPKHTDSPSITTLLPVSYPSLIIYPPVYPHVQPYPPTLSSGSRSSRIVSGYNYPYLAIYAPVYPYFDIYGSGMPSDGSLRSREEGFTIVLGSVNPQLPSSLVSNQDDPFASDEEGGAYPVVLASSPEPPRRSRKTHHELHAAVFPAEQQLSPVSKIPSPTSPTSPVRASRRRMSIVSPATTPTRERAALPPSPVEAAPPAAQQRVSFAAPPAPPSTMREPRVPSPLEGVPPAAPLRRVSFAAPPSPGARARARAGSVLHAAAPPEEGARAAPRAYGLPDLARRASLGPPPGRGVGGRISAVNTRMLARVDEGGDAVGARRESGGSPTAGLRGQSPRDSLVMQRSRIFEAASLANADTPSYVGARGSTVSPSRPPVPPLPSALKPTAPPKVPW